MPWSQAALLCAMRGLGFWELSGRIFDALLSKDHSSLLQYNVLFHFAVVTPFGVLQPFSGDILELVLLPRLPVSRRSFRYRLIVASDIPKMRTISLRERP